MLRLFIPTPDYAKLVSTKHSLWKLKRFIQTLLCFIGEKSKALTKIIIIQSDFSQRVKFNSSE